MMRLIGIAFGIANQLLFVHTIVQLFLFLWGHEANDSAGAMGIDLLLAVGFAVPHSLILWPPFRKRMLAWIPPAFFGCAFCTWTCLSLLTVVGCWRFNSLVVWELHGVTRVLMRVAFVGAWMALFYSLWISGLGRQTGWTNWYAWLQRRPLPRPEFAPRSWYRWLRHPIYLSFLGLIWFTPRMTLDHALLTATWTVYIFVGSWAKDLRLEHYVGASYREYEAKVPGYPFCLIGPLGRRPLVPTSTNTLQMPSPRKVATSRSLG